MASTSTPPGGMTSMARMLASSRLASYHPRASQVYTAPPSHIARGDFGVKRPLPTRHLQPGMVRYVQISDQDTKERQTAWREREREVVLLRRFSELNVRLGSVMSTTGARDLFSTDSRLSKEVARGSLGPRISTTYDPSTRRAVPTNYDGVPNAEIKSYLQSEAQLGRGPVYIDTIQGGSDSGGPFGRASAGYTDSPTLRVNYRTMSEKQFEKYLDHLRANRTVFKDHLGRKAALMARYKVAAKYENRRTVAEREAHIASSTGATKVEVPLPVLEKNLPLPPRSEERDGKSVQVDMWNEIRVHTDASKAHWEPWLRGHSSAKMRTPTSQLLPPLVQPRGGEDMPTGQHIHGGLQYGQPDEITTQLLTNSLPARVLGKAASATRKSGGNGTKSMNGSSVALAGRVSYMPYVYSDDASPIDTSLNNRSSGNIRVKVIGAVRDVKTSKDTELSFRRFPVDQDDRMPDSYGNTALEVRSSERADGDRLAKGLPGSAEWIARLDGQKMDLRSGQGNDRVIDYGDLDGLTSGFSSRSGENSGRRSAKARERQIKRDRLSHPATSSARSLNAFKYVVDPLRKQHSAAAPEGKGRGAGKADTQS